ncbi:MAG TPA: hypothetical protein VEC09_04955 [Actinomycetota bacterium]|nr:hypothetical protein [Actinomycetota bacterium]
MPAARVGALGARRRTPLLSDPSLECARQAFRDLALCGTWERVG